MTTGKITVSGTQLLQDGWEVNLVGFNMWKACITSWNEPPGTGYDLNDVLPGSLADIQTSGGAGLNAARVFFLQQFARHNDTHAVDYSAMDRCLSVCDAAGVKVIACLQDEYNSTGTGYKDATWYSTGYKNTTVAPYETVPYYDWITEAATRYGGDPRIAVWELINEPDVSGGGSCPANAGSIFQAWVSDCSAAVKAADPATPVCIGQGGPGQCGMNTDALWLASNAISTIDLASWHDYQSSEAGFPLPNAQGFAPNGWGLDNRSAQMLTLGKPIYVGECGIHLAAAGGSYGTRAAYIGDKLAYMFANYPNLVGFLPWQWDARGISATGDDYVYGYGDPVVPVLNGYARPRPNPVPRLLSAKIANSGWRSGRGVQFLN